MVQSSPPKRVLATASHRSTKGLLHFSSAIVLSAFVASTGELALAFRLGSQPIVSSRCKASLLQTSLQRRKVHTPHRRKYDISKTTLFMSSVGGGDEDPFGSGDDNGKKNNNPLNEWMKRKESDNVRSAREQYAEARLPISYGAMNGKDKFGPITSANSEETDANDMTNNADETSSSSSSLARRDPMKPNPYLKVVSRLTPSDLISRFTATASPRVQDAVRTTILGLIGGLPQMAFETRTIATGERLASLMFQLQMTGYMFKNAEYRLSLSQSLGAGGVGKNLLLGGSDGDSTKEWRDGKLVKGKIKVRYGGNDNKAEDGSSSNDKDPTPDSDETSSNKFSSSGLEIEVDAQAYMSELSNEVSRLRDELGATKQAKEEEIRKDLLMYIRTLPAQELKELTGTMSPEVLDAMKGLVTAVLAGIGNGEDEDGGKGVGIPGMSATSIGPKTVTEQSGEALAQLCMWQLVVGYNLRELEVREEFRSSLKALGGDIGDDRGDSGVQFGPGALE